ncbi:cell adhesion molecule, putative, partial [Ixodes scapularis]
CPHGTYGPDCRLQRKCYCQEGEACHPQWGYCANATCRQGFKNEPFCDQAYPALRSFAVQSLDEESFRVTWKPWIKDLDTGQGDVEAYRVLFKVHGSTNDWNRTDLIEDDGNGTLTYDVGELAANTEYDVRVVVHDVSGQENAELAPLNRTTTPCGGRFCIALSPLEAPSNLTANVSTPQLIVVSWKLPDARTWRCSRISVQLKINDTQPVDVGSGDRYTLPVKPFTMYVLRVRLVAGVDKTGDWSSPLGLVTPEDAPEAVARIRVYRVSSKTYMLSWNPPSASNGVLRGYEVHYVRLRLLHECEGLAPSDGTQVRVTPNQTYLQLSNLTGGADYEVSVRATTVTDGPWKSHWFTTSHEGGLLRRS